MGKKLRAPSSPEGDDNSIAWTTRVSKGWHQYLLDFQAEYHLPTKSATLQALVALMCKHHVAVMGMEGHETSPKMRTMIEALAAEAEDNERREVRARIIDLLRRANETDLIPSQVRMTKAAMGLAERFGFNWPPAGTNLLEIDQRASWLLEKTKELMSKQSRNRVSLRELAQCCHGRDVVELRKLLDKLQEHGYLTLVEEQRSGPPTLWVEIPVWETAA